MIKVLHLIPDISRVGGVEIYVANLLEYLARHGEFEVHLAEVRAHATGPNTSVYARLARKGVVLHEPPAAGPARYATADFVAGVIDANGIEILHSHLFTTDLACVLVRLGSEAFRAETKSIVGEPSDFAVLEAMISSSRVLSGASRGNAAYRDAFPCSDETTILIPPRPGLTTISTKHLGAVKSFAHDHDIDEELGAGSAASAAHRLNGELQVFVSKNVDVVVTIAEEATRLWQGLSGNCIYIPVGSLTADDRADAHDVRIAFEASSRQAGTNYLFVGRLTVKKMPDLLVSCFVQHLLEFPNDTLTLIGDGLLRARCEELAGGRPAIRFIHHLGRADVLRTMATMDALCLFSLEEGSPLVIHEAAGAALPVLATRVGAIPQLVEDGGSGLLTDFATEESLLSVLDGFSRLSRDEQRRMGMKLFETTEGVDATVGYQQYAELYGVWMRPAPPMVTR